MCRSWTDSSLNLGPSEPDHERWTIRTKEGFPKFIDKDVSGLYLIKRVDILIHSTWSTRSFKTPISQRQNFCYFYSESLYFTKRRYSFGYLVSVKRLGPEDSGSHLKKGLGVIFFDLLPNGDFVGSPLIWWNTFLEFRIQTLPLCLDFGHTKGHRRPSTSFHYSYIGLKLSHR